MTRIRTHRRGGRWLAASTLALVLGSSLPIGFAPAPARAEDSESAEEELDAESLKKAEWQDRYRVLRNNAVRMRDNAIKLRRAYSLSQHSNYPRGGARMRFKQQVIDTEQKAEEFEAQLARFQEEARQEQIPPGWIYEVEDEPVDPGSPAAFGEDEPSHENPAPAGRNPAFYGGDESDDWDDEAGDEDRGDAFDDFNDDREDQYRANPDWRDR